jgi:hypothetical protein
MGGILDDFDHILGEKELENREGDVEDGQTVSSVTGLLVDNRNFEAHVLQTRTQPLRLSRS